jgi:DNA modification methylase
VSESFLNGKVTLHRGDCLEVLPLLEENSIDSCVTDPPLPPDDLPMFGGGI